MAWLRLRRLEAAISERVGKDQVVDYARRKGMAAARAFGARPRRIRLTWLGNL